MAWFIVDVYSDAKMQYRVAAETVEADASDEAQRRVAELYPRARTFRCMEIREKIAQRLASHDFSISFDAHVAGCDRCQSTELAAELCSDGLALWVNTLLPKED